MKHVLVVVPLVVCTLAAIRAHADTLTVLVDGVRDARGHVRIGVCTRPQFLSEQCTFHAVAPSAAGQVAARITIRPGTYAIAAYQDATDTGHLRRSLLGVPKDGIGFSRDPGMRFGPPSFDASAIRIGPGDHTVTLTLHYF